jgi:hypothetical protein
MPGVNKRGTFGVSLLSTAGFNRLWPAVDGDLPLPKPFTVRDPGLETARFLANVS